MRLLLIEDEAPLRLGLARQLEADGYRVDQAADGEDGLFQAREYPVDLAIVDLGLPKMNGLAVVQTLRFGGTVHLLGDAELPGLEVVGAILRYAPPPAATSTPSYLLVLRLARATN